MNLAWGNVRRELRQLFLFWLLKGMFLSLSCQIALIQPRSLLYGYESTNGGFGQKRPFRTVASPKWQLIFTALLLE